MNAPIVSELCFNLWYYLTFEQTITALAARAYLLDGSEEEKADLLFRLSAHDFELLVPRSPPAVLCRRFPGGSVPYYAITHLGVETIFAELFDEIRRGLPPSMAFPDEKLFFATPLFDFGDGFQPARIGDGVVTSR